MKHCIRVGNSLTRHSDDAVRFPEETAEDIAVNTSHVEETAEEIDEYGGSEESTEERGAQTCPRKSGAKYFNGKRLQRDFTNCHM